MNMKNRLKLMKIYCCGPMCRAREEGKVWREELTPWLNSRGMIVLNPYKKPILEDEGVENDDSFMEIIKCKENKDWQTLSNIMKPIRHIDLRMTDEASCLFVYLDLNGSPCGSYEEIFLANRQMKPIVLVCPQGRQNIPNWLYGVFPFSMMFETIEESKEYLRHIDEDETIDKLGRWRFFDLESEYRRILGC